MIFSTRMVNWVCPYCTTTAQKPFALENVEYHLCPGMGMLTVQMVEEGMRVKVTANEREDYINGEAVQTDSNNRPIMNVTVEREDGIDCTVYAPAVTTTARRE